MIADSRGQKPSVIAIVERTRAIRWWVDRQIEKGKTDDEITAELPVAVAFITGRLTEADLLAAVAR